MMMKDIIGNDELAYFAEDKVFKNFRHYTQKRYRSVIFDQRFISGFEDRCDRMAFPFIGDTLL